MSIQHFHTAQLDSDDLQQLQQLEQELGLVLVAIEQDPEPASLNSEQLQRIQTLEQHSGKVLLAYPSH